MTGDERSELTLGGRVVPYRIRLSSRARRLQIQVDFEKGVEVVVPQRARRANPTKFITDNADWVLRQLARIDEQKLRTPPADFADGGQVPLLGHPCPVRRRPTAAPKPHARYARGVLEILGPEDAPEADARAAVVALFRRIAREILTSRADHWCRQLMVVRGRIAVRAQKTLWGSCSHEGTLSFNWRLVLASPEIIDYVVLHEVTHLVQMNHGPRFYALMARFMPDWERHERWLDRHGDTLRM